MLQPESLEKKSVFFSLLTSYFLVFSGVDVHAHSQIVHGNEAPADNFQYMVAIKTIINDLAVLCGGTLIHPQLVLTAAKCLFGATRAEVIPGAHNLETLKEAEVITVEKEAFIIHEYYNSSRIRHDIGVLVLEKPVESDGNIKIINIPQLDDVTKTYDGLSGIIVGWGKTSDTANKVSDILHYAEVTIIPLISCQIVHVLDPLNLDQMCTSGTAKVNICLGDNGGPLIVDDVQVGIASYGDDVGCEIGFPGVYTRLTSYLEWLNNTLAEVKLEKPFRIL